VHPVQQLEVVHGVCSQAILFAQILGQAEGLLSLLILCISLVYKIPYMDVSEMDFN